MARFFLQSTATTGRVSLQGDDAKHISRVLRLRPGEQVELVVSGQPYLAKLLTVDYDLVTAELESRLAQNGESPLRIHLYQALPKADKMDLIVQKATELGVNAITPVLTSRVVAKPEDLTGGQKLLRWQRIAMEAAKQCRRSLIPPVNVPLALTDLPEMPSSLRLVAWEEASRPLADLLAGQSPQAIDLLVGPEGGLTESEVDHLRQLGFQSISLGQRILRTETAPLALISILQYQLGDLGGKNSCRE